MYGTVARVRAKAGAGGQLSALQDQYEGLQVPGFVATYVYRSDADPDEYWLVVLFEDRESYHRNAQDPAQDERFRQMRELLAADPEWHDGEVISGPRPA